MATEPLTEADRALIDQATDVLQALTNSSFHSVGAAIRTNSGATYTGIDLLPSVGTAGIHAEPIAIGRAIIDGEPGLETSVAVKGVGTPQGPRVISACGVCRELINDYAPEARIVVPGPDGPVKRPIGDILPDKG
ncbi:MAG: hypothetical protein R3324_03845 [Halobacteriales archaeon]|nr:hypothetical protein [Halobacteriales archaeon]